MLLERDFRSELLAPNLRRKKGHNPLEDFEEKVSFLLLIHDKIGYERQKC